MRNKCIKCGANVLEGDLCWKHKPKKLSSPRYIPKKKKISTKDKENIQKMKDFFLQIWNTRPHISEISGEKIYGDFSSVYMHHILYKQKYPEAMYDSENIIILAASEHQTVHIIPDKYEEINKRRELLLKKYEKD